MLASTLASVWRSWVANALAWFSEPESASRVLVACVCCCSSEDCVDCSCVCAVCSRSMVVVTSPVAMDEYSERMLLAFMLEVNNWVVVLLVPLLV